MIETRFAVKLKVLISNSIFIDNEEEGGDEDGDRCVNRPSAHRRSNYLFDKDWTKSGQAVISVEKDYVM